MRERHIRFLQRHEDCSQSQLGLLEVGMILQRRARRISALDRTPRHCDEFHPARKRRWHCLGLSLQLLLKLFRLPPPRSAGELVCRDCCQQRAAEPVVNTGAVGLRGKHLAIFADR